jgi:hypothetical protein
MREHSLSVEAIASRPKSYFPSRLAVREHTKADGEASRDALYASKIVACALGYKQIAAAPEQFKGPETR